MAYSPVSVSVPGHSSGTPPDPTLGVQIQREGAHLRVPLFNAPLEGAGTRRYSRYLSSTFMAPSRGAVLASGPLPLMPPREGSHLMALCICIWAFKPYIRQLQEKKSCLISSGTPPLPRGRGPLASTAQRAIKVL